MRLSHLLFSKHTLLLSSRQRRTRHLVRVVSLGLLSVACLAGTLILTDTLATHAYNLTSITITPKSQATSLTKPQSVSTPPASTQSSTVLTSAPAVSTVTTPLPQCTPDTSYAVPTEITPTQPGLQQVIDSPSTYTVYGNTTAQINAQIAECTPVLSTGTGGTAGRYVASTANTISWQTTYTDNGLGVCSMASVDVTLHINQVFPQWQPTSGSPASLSGLWQTYSAKLHAYEQGHVQLDEAAAQAVLTDLQTLPSMSCDVIAQTANAKANADLASYLTANANYDTVNDFGLTEDVVL